MAMPSMPWGERPSERREILPHCSVSVQGIGFNFVEEAISAPTDWRFQEDQHVMVVHRNGRLRSMESEFEKGPSGRILPSVGDIWMIPAGQRYAALAQGDTVGYCEMKIPTALLGREAIVPRMGHRDPFLHSAVDRLAGLGARDDDTAFLLRDTIGEAIRLHLLDGYTPISGRAQKRRGRSDLSPSQRRLFLDHLDAELDARHSLAGMAGLVGMAIPEFVVAFSASFGMTPHQFLIAYRIRRAKELLVGSRSSITTIGLAVGFSTPSHFANSFKQAVGITPSAYRKAASRG